MTFQLGTNSMRNMEGIDDRLIDIAELAITLSPVDFGIPSTGGFRTTEDQAALYTAGKSKADVLTAANKLGYKCEWGGTWAKQGKHYGWDMPHFNITER